MEQNLDTLMQQQMKRLYNRLQNAYDKRIKEANDKLYAIAQFEKRMKSTTELRYEWNDEYKELIEHIEDDYRLGISIVTSIRKFRKKYQNPIIYTSEGIITINEAGEDVLEENVKQKRKTEIFEKYSDKDMVWEFAQYQTYKNFFSFLESEKQKFAPPTETLNNASTEETVLDKKDKKKKDEYTIRRQVLAIHYLMKYCQVKDIDLTVISRFIEFLTSKNESNIYKKLRNPLYGSPQNVKEDLIYVRKYFEELQLEEIVKMINNEIVQSV